MTKELKILYLGFWSPPEIRPRAIAVGKLMPELIRQGVRPVIITYKSDTEWEINTPIYKISPYLIRGIFKKITITRVIAEYFYYKNTFKEIKRIIKKHEINIVFSFSNPQASNILGAMIKRKLNIPFVSHFSDPWYDNPYKIFEGLSKWKTLFLEKFIIKNSDKIVFTNPQALDLVMQKYSQLWRKKSEVIAHCYNPKDYPEKVEKSDKFIFSYIGAFYKQRNPNIFFQSLEKVLNNNPELKKKCLVKLIGVINDYTGYSKEKVEIMINQYGLAEIVEVLPVVNYQESLGFMKEADCLINIDANFKNSPFLPSKLIDYAGSETMILGISPQNSPTDIFLEKLGYKKFDYSQKKELEEYLENLINQRVDIRINKQFLEKFNVQNIVRKFINLFQEVLNN